ncbi:probable disease resistance protein At1g12280 [Durio zibethinus]|uniref:Probable disease resistance protein At1g12280 n=1 Tax=Durio zibethinus TaxID=66656 RepID=A0A6P5YUF9_DURZI|nr:probable disease resistance protein At1g12280 [Durio zibethinus]
MEAVIASVGEKAGEFAFDLIKREVTYISNYKSNVENLKEGFDEPKDARQRVKHSVDAAKTKGRKIYKDVEKWLFMVDEETSEEAAAKLEDEEKAKEKLSKRAEKEADSIAQLLGKGRFDSVSYLPALRHVNGYDAFASRTGALNGVMEALKNDDSNIIGVYGVGRAAITRLVKQFARLAMEKQLFDEVIMAAITQTPNIEKIQNEIAKNLGLKFDEASLDARRFQLRDRLKKQKKVLIILDDIWVTLDLNVLGLPSRGEHMGCKILLTSRNFNVLSSMGIQKPFAISIFKKQKSWNPIRNMVSDIVERSNLYFTTIEVAQKCAELPVAIATIANTSKNKKTLFELRNVLQELKRPLFQKLQKQTG